MTDEIDELERELEAFQATWREGGLKDPELTYVLGNLRGFISHLRRARFCGPIEIGKRIDAALDLERKRHKQK